MIQIDDPYQLREALKGRTITGVEFDDVKATEEVRLFFSDGSNVRLFALGWHDIQSLCWEINQ